MENNFKWHPASELPTETGRYLTYVNWRRVSDDGLRVEDDYHYEIDKFNAHFNFWVKGRLCDMVAWSAIPEVDIND